MNNNETKETIDPRYAPPYPQEFHKFWPRHVIKAGIIVISIIALIVFLAYKFSLPADPNNPPMPDEGMYIPGPEWYYLFFLQPFWYLTGDLTKWRFVATFIVPLTIIFAVVIVPFIFRKITLSGLIWRLLAFFPFVLIGAGIIFSGYQAKTQGCPSCHNPFMGARQAMPPMDIAEYYGTNRQRQIEVGKYRASKSESEAEGGGAVRDEVETYKDANWQMRHIYEPTFTW